MTEAEWLVCGDPDRMRNFLYDPPRVTYRKLRLYACACCRLISTFMASRPDVESLEHAEREADGLIPPDADYPYDEVLDIRWYRRDGWNAVDRAVSSYHDFLWDSERLHEKAEDERAVVRSRGDRLLSDLLRCLVGNPFRPATFSPEWLTPTVVQLARGIYEERAFDRMPILADSLQDAGCDNEDVLGHCRDANGVHVRGCWVVDLVLGKS